MTAGAKDTRVAFERATVTRNRLNEAVEGPWEPVATVLCEVVEIKDGEQVRAAQVGRETTQWLICWWSRALWSLKAGDQAVFGDVVHRITGKKPRGRQREIEFTVCARPDLAVDG